VPESVQEVAEDLEGTSNFGQLPRIQYVGSQRSPQREDTKSRISDSYDAQFDHYYQKVRQPNFKNNSSGIAGTFAHGHYNQFDRDSGKF